MAEEVYRASRKSKITPDELKNADNPLGEVQKVQQAVAQETGKDVVRPFSPEASPFEVHGNLPPAFREALQRRQQQMSSQPAEPGMPLQWPPRAEPVAQTKAGDVEFEPFEAPPERPRPQSRVSPTPDAQVPSQKASGELDVLLERLAKNHQWEQFSWASGGKFYHTIPPRVDIRPMTGEEEQILGTPRLVKQNKAIDMIFQKCIRQPLDTRELLSVDRNHLLIFLRGISYTPEYDVEIKCPLCDFGFPTVVNLNDLEVESCPDTFGPDSLHGVLPKSGFRYSYRLATGADEIEIAQYRERRNQTWGDQGEDDTLLYRTALLLEEVEGVRMKKELSFLLKKLPIQDVAHLRNEINNPPFGVDMTVPLLCPACSREFKIDLPLETNFFFPGKKMEKTQA